MIENDTTSQTPADSIPPALESAAHTCEMGMKQESENTNGITDVNLQQSTVDLSNNDLAEKDNLKYAVPASILQVTGPLIAHLPADMPDHHKRICVMLASHVPHKDIAEVIGCSIFNINLLSVRYKEIVQRLRSETVYVLQHVVSNIVSVGLDKLYHSVLSWESKLTPAQTSQAVNALSGLVRMTTELTQAADKTGNNPSGLPSPRSIAQLDNALNKVRGVKT